MLIFFSTSALTELAHLHSHFIVMFQIFCITKVLLVVSLKFLTVSLLSMLSSLMAFDITEFKEYPNSFDFSFRGDNFQESLLFHIHPHHLEVTCLVLHRCKVYFSLIIIFTIEAVAIWMGPCAKYQEF